MRATLLLLIFTTFTGLFLWVTLSGALLFISLCLLLTILLISVGYSDTVILFILGAREVRSDDETDFHAAALQEAYKLAVSQPRLYFYNGAIGRAFVLQNHQRASLVLNKELLNICTREELAAICFELLLQIKNHQAAKRTRVMFLVGVISWFFHSVVDLLARILPFKEVYRSLNWLIHYLVQPWLEIIFKFSLGEKYFRKMETQLDEFPKEKDILIKVGIKLGQPLEGQQLSGRKILEFSGLNKSRQFQNILTLELMPHEWDLIFDTKWDTTRAQ